MMVFPAAYTTLLDWRTRPTAALMEQAGRLAYQESSRVRSLDMLSLDLSLKYLRSAVAPRHDAVNRLLERICAGVLGLIACSLIFLWQQARSFGAFCDHPGRHPILTFLSTPLPVLMQNHLQDLLARQRAEVERQKVERRRAETTESTAPAAPKEATPEERLGLLLESIKPLCESPEEYSGSAREASRILASQGFRPARSYIVGRHNDLRERQKAAGNVETDATADPIL